MNSPFSFSTAMKTFFLLAIGLSLAACVSPPAENAARLTTSPAAPGTPAVQLRSIDGTPVTHLSEATLAPGRHRIVLGLHQDVAGSSMSRLGLAGQALGEGIDDFRSRRAAEGLDLDAQPGATYRARAVGGGYEIVDAGTGRVVSRAAR